MSWRKFRNVLFVLPLVAMMMIMPLAAMAESGPEVQVPEAVVEAPLLWPPVCKFEESISVTGILDPVFNIKYCMKAPWFVWFEDVRYEVEALAENGTVLRRYPAEHGPQGQILYGHIFLNWVPPCTQVCKTAQVVLPRAWLDGTAFVRIRVYRGAKIMEWLKTTWELPWPYPGQVAPAIPANYTGLKLTASDTRGGKGFVAIEVLTSAGWDHRDVAALTHHEVRSAWVTTGTDVRVLLVNGAGVPRAGAKFTWNGVDYVANALGYAVIPAASVLQINDMYVK